MLTPSTFSRIYRISAWYDVAVTWPFATPLTLAAMWNVMNGLHGSLALPALPGLSVHGTLFANFFGSVVLIWSAVRLIRNDPRLARYDAAGRWLFSAWMVNALMHGGSPLLGAFLTIELGFAVLQSLPVRTAAPA